MPKAASKLPATTKVIYGVGDVGNAIVDSTVQFFLMIFYTDAALIAPALAANALLAGKVWDAINDPLFGWLSDRTTSRLGKRRIYMIVGAIPLAIAVALLWRVPVGLSTAGIFVWIAATFIFFDTVWTLTNVPYYALTAELTEDYDERASLTAFRMVLGVPAFIVGAAMTPALVGLFPTKREGYAFIGVLYGVFAAAALLIAAAGIRERSEMKSSAATSPPLRALGNTLRNGPFLRLILAYFIANAAFALVRTLLAYYLTYQLGMEDQVPFVMLLLLLFVGLFLFPWKMVSDRWNKGPAYACGLALGAAAVAFTFVLPKSPTPWVYAIGLPLLIWYPITRASHAKLLERLGEANAIAAGEAR